MGSFLGCGVHCGNFQPLGGGGSMSSAVVVKTGEHRDGSVWLATAGGTVRFTTLKAPCFCQSSVRTQCTTVAPKQFATLFTRDSGCDSLPP